MHTNMRVCDPAYTHTYVFVTLSLHYTRIFYHLCKRVMAHMQQSHAHVWMSHSVHMMWHIWMIHNTHVNTSWYTYEWVMSHMWINQVLSRWNRDARNRWLLAHTCMSHVTYRRKSFQFSQDTHVNESCHTCEQVTSHADGIMIWGGYGQ